MAAVKRRRGTIYVFVMLTSAIVASLAIGGAVARRSMADRMHDASDAARARQTARSVFELALNTLTDDDGDWVYTDARNVLADVILNRSFATAYFADKTTHFKLTTAELPASGAYLIAEAYTGNARVRLACEVTDTGPDLHARALSLGPIRYYPLNEGSGSIGMSESTATLGGVYSDSNISGRTTGPEDGNAPWFSDNNDNAGSAAGANFDIGNGTITFWVNPGADRWDRVIAMKAGYFSQGNGDVVFLIDDDRIAVYHEISGPDSYLVGDNLPENTWSFVTYSFGQSGAKLRVNVNSPSTNGSFKGGLEYTFDDIFRFGGPAGYDYAGVDEELDGSVLGFAVFDRILTTPELRYIYEIDEIPLTIDPDSTRWIVD